MSTMKFCRECNNILYPKEDKENETLLYACRNCDHQEVADDNCVYKMEIRHSTGEGTDVLKDAASDASLPRTRSVKCCNCNHPEAVFFQMWIIRASTNRIWVLVLSTSRFDVLRPRICVYSTLQGRRRHGSVFHLLQPKLWSQMERLMKAMLSKSYLLSSYIYYVDASGNSSSLPNYCTWKSLFSSGLGHNGAVDGNNAYLPPLEKVGSI